METLPFEIGETAHALRRAFDRRAAGLGATRAQWKVLFKLSRAPGLRQVELADMLDVEPITLCRIIDRLEEFGLVERRQDPDDRRARRLHVTAQAQPLIEKLQALAAELAVRRLPESTRATSRPRGRFWRAYAKMRGAAPDQQGIES